MKPLFADTSYFVAYCGPNDLFHQRAVELGKPDCGDCYDGVRPRRNRRPSLASRGSARVCELGARLESDPSVLVVPASKALFQAGSTYSFAGPTSIGRSSIVFRSSS